MPQTLQKLVKEVDNVCHVYGKEVSTIKSKLYDKEDECEKLKVEKISLMKQVASLNEAVNATKWVDFKQNALHPPQVRHCSLETYQLVTLMKINCITVI